MADKHNEQQRDSSRRPGPTDAQLDAAIEGLRSERASLGTGGDRTNQPFGGGSGRAGSGNPMGGGGLGIGTSSAGPGEQPDDPSAETGGPRGAGTAISATSGGLTAGDDRPRRNPEELIRERTGRPIAEREHAGRGRRQR